jgi:hypothetical protein
MIDVENVWVPQIIGYADLVANADKMRSAFNRGDKSLWTSVNSYDELIEQVFDDLDALGMLEALHDSSLGEPLKLALDNFVRFLDAFDRNLAGTDPDFASSEWLNLRDAAAVVVTSAENRSVQ